MTEISEDDIAILCIPVADESPRQWSVGEHSGAIFADDEAEEYRGWCVVIEVRSEAEARIIAQTLAEHVGPGWVGFDQDATATEGRLQ